MNNKRQQLKSIVDFLPKSTRELLVVKGSQIVKTMGEESIKKVILDVLCGENVRSSTETLTRKRIATLNAGILMLFYKGATASPDFISSMPTLVIQELKRVHKKEDRILLQWLLGLTDKAYQNILRDDPDALNDYKDKFCSACEEVIDRCNREFGEMRGSIELNGKQLAEINWKFMTYFLNAIGAQTIATRGAEKSLYGKLFEKLILGTLLSILGFEYVRPEDSQELKRIFWLSTRGEKRESDATLLYEAGKGVKFDIGFIGRGNPEISLDKVTRFEREISLGGSKWYMSTVIIVDRIGERSKIPELAKRAKGRVVQMSMGFWVRDVAKILKEEVGFRHEIIGIPDIDMKEFLANKLKKIDVKDFLVLEKSVSYLEDESY